MILVRLYCPRCNRVVHDVERRPEDWSGVLMFESCRCSRLDLRSGRGQEVARRQRLWFESEMFRTVAWEDLREHIERAERVGRPQRVTLLLT